MDPQSDEDKAWDRKQTTHPRPVRTRTDDMRLSEPVRNV